MNLQFISVEQGGSTRQGGHERRLIRSHVMKGRNAGKSRSSVQQLVPAKRTLLRYNCLGCSELRISRRVHTCACYKQALDMRQLIFDDLALVSVPYQLDTRLRGLIHQCFTVATQALYPPKFCHSDDSFISPWIRFVFEDEAYLQCLLAMVASYGDFFAGRPCVSPRALGYLTKAYALVNQRLSGPEATSETTIATVTTLAMYQRIHHSEAIGMIHFEGLQSMIRLRGGMANLARDNRDLAQKPWRLDLEFAIQDGSPVRFTGEDAPSSVYPTREKDSMSLSSCLPQIEPGLLAATVDIESFTRLLNGTSKNNKLNQLDFSQHVQHLIHRLLHHAPLAAPKQLTRIENVLHLALLATMVTLLHEYGRQHSQYKLLSETLRDTLLEFAAVGQWEEEFLLWALFVAGISVLDEQDDAWLLPEVQLRCQRLALHTWEQAQEVLHSFVWIHSLHDSPGKQLYEAANRTDVS